MYPCVIGVSRLTDKTNKSSMLELFAESVNQAIHDSGKPVELSGSITDIVSVRTALEDRLEFFGASNSKISFKNLPYSIAKKAGVTNAPKIKCWSSTAGGNTPQMLVNMFSDKIASGQCDCVVIVGGEMLAAYQHHLSKNKAEPEWGDHFEHGPAADTVPTVIGLDKPGVSQTELINSLVAPRQMYPLLEQAYRGNVTKLSIRAHLERQARIFEKFNAVASQQPADLAWFPQKRSAEEIASAGPNNRWICYPYTKYVNSVMNVNQAAAIILTSESFANQLGVASEKRVYLRGCGDCVEPAYFVTERERLHESVGMRFSFETALQHAQCTSKDIAFFDLYSCFPIAVEVACDILNIDPLTEKRPLTVTGGLPYYGGAGNAYTCMSIAAMVQKLRENPPSLLGLVNGNGWFLSKHSAGVYSRQKPSSWIWKREDPKMTQERANRTVKLVEVVESRLTNEEGVIESYIVDFSNKKKPPVVFVVGRLIKDNRRFIASGGVENINGWVESDMINARLSVSTLPSGKNKFVLNKDIKTFPRSEISVARL